MLRKLFAVAILAVAALTAVATPRAAYAIEYICSCSFCAARPSWACYDTEHLSPPFNRVACSTYYSQWCD